MASTISSSVLKISVGPAGQAQAMRTEGMSGAASERDKLGQVAEQFEALFVKSILSSARSAQLADPILNNEGLKTFNSMLDSEYATALSQRETLGIADALVAQFQHRVSSGDD